MHALSFFCALCFMFLGCWWNTQCRRIHRRLSLSRRLFPRLRRQSHRASLNAACLRSYADNITGGVRREVVYRTCWPRSPAFSSLMPKSQAREQHTKKDLVRVANNTCKMKQNKSRCKDLWRLPTARKSYSSLYNSGVRLVM